MMALPFGSIVLTDFPFTDLSATKRRPALVVSGNNERRIDVVVAYITSAQRHGADAAPIAATDGTGLKVPSLVRFDKLATINKNIITGRLGHADPAWLADNAPAFFSVFGFRLL